MNLQTEIAGLGLAADDVAMAKWEVIRDRWRAVGLAEADEEWHAALKLARDRAVDDGRLPTLPEQLAPVLAAMRQAEVSRVRDMADLGRGTSEYPPEDWRDYFLWVQSELVARGRLLLDDAQVRSLRNLDACRALAREVDRGRVYPLTYLQARKALGLKTIGHLRTILKYHNPREYREAKEHGECH